MMNRRLRERLTEAEILQIFVDVCEGVAFMHNSRPALLHRDLKVENILQSSPTSYKLCDFGSATTVSRPPTNTQEIRALEAEIGRHTTMQYRAPEMIDLYSKRPIDEKSDVWALGVLLYKLCYYTTPFEEHGSLAILNVQYRIPPYPVYSSQMNMLIGEPFVSFHVSLSLSSDAQIPASMLREHGTQRPSVYEVLNHVHYLRGTKSQFTYNIPTAQPIAPRQQSQKSTSQSQTSASQGQNTYAVIPPYKQGPRNAHDTQPTSHTSPPNPNAGVQAREKVLEAIAPMRRGRPRNDNAPSRPSSPPKNTTPLPPHSASSAAPTGRQQDANWLDNEEAAWKSMSAQAKAREKANALFGEAWKVSGPSSASKVEGEHTRQTSMGFGDDFAEKLWRAPNPNSSSATPPRPSPDPASLLKPSLMKPLSHTGNDQSFRGSSNSQKDAFEGLGLMTSMGRPAPTLAEARKLRTGLAIMSTQTHNQRGYNQSESSPRPTGQNSRPTPSPRPSYLTPTNGGKGFSTSNYVSPVPSPVPTGSSWQNANKPSPSVSSTAPTAPGPDGTPIESRFPSLEEIDAQFPASSLYPSSTRAPDRDSRFLSQQPKSASAVASSSSNNDKAPQLPPRPKPVTITSEDSIRAPIKSAPVVKDPSSLESLQKRFDVQPPKGDWKAASFRSEPQNVGSLSLNPPAALRSKRSSMTMKYAIDSTPSSTSSTESPSDRTAPREDKYQRSPKPPPRDWLTGDDSEDRSVTPIKQQSTPSRSAAVLRDTPAKKASVTLPNEFKFPNPSAAQHDTTPVSRPQELPPQEDSPTLSRFKTSFPPIDTEAANEVAARSDGHDGLTDNWSPIASKQPTPPRIPPKPLAHRINQSQSIDSASSADEDEGPEDAGRLSPSKTRSSSNAQGSLRRRKGRQSSVHDLVDLWGGGVKDKEKVASPSESTGRYSGMEMETTKTPKARPTSLMPPSSAGVMTSQFGGRRGSVSPQRSPVQRAPSPISPAYVPASYERAKDKEDTHNKVASAPPARERPQSMFIFPAKQQVSEPLTSPAYPPPQASPKLSPQPDEEKPSNKGPVRRTSISKVVQRYEAIGGKVITPQPVPSSPRMRKVSVKTTLPLAADNSSTTSLPLQRVKVLPGPEPAPKPAGRDEFRPNRVVASVGGGPIAGTAIGSNAEPMKMRTRTTSSGRSLSNAKPLVDVVRGNNYESGDYRSSATTGKTSPVDIKRPDAPSGRFGGHGHHAKEPSTSTATTGAGISFPKRMPTLALDDPSQQQQSAASRSDEDLSSSPERPYLGVGRLIDQWQRKAEDKTPAGGGSNAAAIQKRVGLVNGTGR